MKRMKYLIVLAFIAVVLISGCVSKDPGKENDKTEISHVAPRPTAGFVPGGEQKEVSPAKWPMFAITGQVTLIAYSTMTNSPEYSIKLTIQNAAQSPVTFNRIVARYNDQGTGKTLESSIYQTTLNYGEAIQPTIETIDLREMQTNVEAAGKKTIVIHISLENGDEDISGDYIAALPPLSYMEKFSDQSHHLDFAKN